MVQVEVTHTHSHNNTDRFKLFTKISAHIKSTRT